MAIDLNNNFDALTVRRISNLEERVRDLFTAQNQMVSLTQTQELLTVISTELQQLNETIISLERRVSILEDIPDID
jgi:polyhydroxyalkanoate synthesis regulator phasin